MKTKFIRSGFDSCFRVFRVFRGLSPFIHVVPLLAGIGLFHFPHLAMAQPVAATLAATSVGQTNSTLNGTVNPNSVATSAYFRYGLTTNYGSYSATNALAATNATLSVTNMIHGLSAGTTYHFELVATNSQGSSAGSDLTFTTPGSPTVTTAAATGVTSSIATLNGTVNPNWDATTAYFQFGLTTNYGNVTYFTGLPATNTALSVAALLSSVPGASWMQTTAPAENWSSIASSAGGTNLAAAVAGGGIYTSPDGGATWTQTGAVTTNWSSIASSADGTHLTAVVNGGGIFTSTNSGGTWTQRSAPITNWVSIASSADGTHLAALVSGGGIYTSTNSGSTWTRTSAPSGGWTCIASSTNGTHLAATYSGGVYTSGDGGVTWTATGAPIDSWSCIASSADGTKLAITSGDGAGIWTSTNSGGVWVQTIAPYTRWTAIASSADGARLAATLATGIYTSTNGGSTWTQSVAPGASWQSIASSADGTRLATVVAGGGVYTAMGPPITLAPGTTYHYRVVGVNGVGTRVGNDLTFTTGPVAPTVTTLAASAVGATNATLNGTVNPNGASSSAYYQYGLTTSYGSYSATNTVMATNVSLSVPIPIHGLAPDTVYHFQLVARNTVGVSLGSDLTFTNSAAAPTATTLAADGITATGARLNGTVNPNGAGTTAYFRYGLTTGYGSYSSTNNLAANNVAQPVSSMIGGLTQGTTYHFQMVSSNSLGAGLGNDLTFATSILPVATSLAATSITASNATLNGSVNPEGAATLAYFQYGLTTNYGDEGVFTQLPANNTTASLPGLVVSSLRSVAGTNWAQTGAPYVNWNSMASSADGIRLAATVQGGGIYTSTNGGATWTNTSAPAANWYSIASSADGSRLAAAAYHNGIYTSTNAGATWTQTSANSSADYVTIASSADGTQLAAGDLIENIYTSTNGGVTWITGPNYGWYSIASSADGTHLAAVVTQGPIVTSVNGGATWTQTSATGAYWSSIASSADGMNLAAVTGGPGAVAGGIYTSTDGGRTWSTNGPAILWQSITSSADGSRLSAAAASGGIYTSTNGGVTWTQGNAPATNWHTIVSSADGTRLAAAGAGSIYTSVGAASPLTPGTMCHYRAVGVSGAGAGYGNDLTFTIQGPPTVVTLAATSINPTNATLNGSVNPNGATTSAYFQYGLTTSYGSYSATNILVATNVTLSVSNLISGLTQNTTYHFRLFASNSTGTNAGADMLFTTTSAQAVNFGLSGAAKAPGGAFQFSFTNLSGLGFTVLATTNVSLPLTNWTVLGAPTEAPPGQYQFTDSQATNTPDRYYRVRSP